jgi:hypothetical protein
MPRTISSTDGSDLGLPVLRLDLRPVLDLVELVQDAALLFGAAVAAAAVAARGKERADQIPRRLQLPRELHAVGDPLFAPMDQKGVGPAVDGDYPVGHPHEVSLRIFDAACNGRVHAPIARVAGDLGDLHEAAMDLLDVVRKVGAVLAHGMMQREKSHTRCPG